MRLWPVPAAPRCESLRVVPRRQLSRTLSSVALRTRRCGLLASGAPSPALNADTFSCSTHRTPPWRVWSLVSSRALDEKVWCPRTEAVPHAKISEASFPHTLLQCVRQHASEIFPWLRVRHDRLAAAERHCRVRLIHVPRKDSRSQGCIPCIGCRCLMLPLPGPRGCTRLRPGHSFGTKEVAEHRTPQPTHVLDHAH